MSWFDIALWVGGVIGGLALVAWTLEPHTPIDSEGDNVGTEND